MHFEIKKRKVIGHMKHFGPLRHVFSLNKIIILAAATTTSHICTHISNLPCLAVEALVSLHSCVHIRFKSVLSSILSFSLFDDDVPFSLSLLFDSISAECNDTHTSYAKPYMYAKGDEEKNE